MALDVAADVSVGNFNHYHKKRYTSLLSLPSPFLFRVNDVLLNNEDFSRAYNCPFGSPMNPRHKCHVW
ncbi:unnamed protein product [Trichobilharzia regenti]|nr:unnamed protein product [Trichobilharzia regenti]